MDKDKRKHKADNAISSGHAREQERGSGLATAAKAFRTTTAIAVFGLPLVAGIATFLGYGVYKAYKRITSRS